MAIVWQARNNCHLLRRAWQRIAMLGVIINWQAGNSDELAGRNWRSTGVLEMVINWQVDMTINWLR